MFVSYRTIRETKLWLLRRRADVVTRDVNPWAPWFDRAFGFVIRTQTEFQARGLAQAAAGAEGRGSYPRLGASEDELAEDVWLDQACSESLEPGPGGKAGIILVNRRRD